MSSSRQFRPGPDNLFVDVIRRATSSSRRTIYSTINYDMLIELSATCLGRGWSSIVPREHYSDIPVLKLHGSCNLFPDVGKSVFTGIPPSDSPTIYEGPVVSTLPENAERFLRTQDVLGPVIAFYEQKKRVIYAPDKVREIQAVWQREVAQANRVYIVGVAVNPLDSHIWEPLASTPAELGYVGLRNDNDAFDRWCAEVRTGPAEVVAEGFNDAVKRFRFS